MSRKALVLLALFALGTAPLIVGAPLWLQALGVWLLGCLVPGYLLTDLLVEASVAPPTPLERGLLTLGSGFALLTIVLLALSYLPGGLVPFLVYGTFAVECVLLSAAYWLRTRYWVGNQSANATSHADTMPDAALSFKSAPWIILCLVFVLLIGSSLRLSALDYAEFHGDEARSALRAAAVIQGQEDALLLHRKAPGEILVPTAVFALAGRLDEVSARLLFALAGIGALGAVFLLGWRMFGPITGGFAALILAMDGYLIGFARFVQYQSIVLLLSVLIVLIAYRIYRKPAAVASYLTLAALLFGAALLFHYDALLAGLPAAFLLGAAFWKKRIGGGALLRATLPAMLVGGAVVALFYIPFILHPNFSATLDYLWSGRIHGELRFPYNNLEDAFLRTTIYSSIYYALFMVVSTFVALVLAYRRGLAAPWWQIAGIGAAAIFVLCLYRYNWGVVGETDFTFLPVTLSFALVWFLPRLSVEGRTLWLWFGAPFLAAMFFIIGPKTHIHIFFVPWALLAADVIASGLRALGRVRGRQAAMVGAGVIAGALVAVFGLYGYLMYVDHSVERMVNRGEGLPKPYWAPSAIATTDSLYGFPLSNGWKVVGQLYADGVLSGDYETNQTFDWIPGWYTGGQRRCDSTATWYFLIDSLEPWIESSEAVKDRAIARGFLPWATVSVDGDPHMEIFKKPAPGEQVAPPQEIALEAYVTAFDLAATPEIPLDYPVVERSPTEKMAANLDNTVRLEGYDLDLDGPLHPGDSLRVTLYWRTLRNMDTSYKVFVQSFYGDGVMVAQQDSLPVCNRHLTPVWRPGELVIDSHDLVIADDAPSGSYPLIVGMYDPETLQRLPLLDEAGNPQDTVIWLRDIDVEGTP